MTHQLLEKLCYKLSKVYDLELAEKLAEIFTDLADQVKEYENDYIDRVRQLAEIQVKYEKIKREKEIQERLVKSYKTAFNVAKKVYDEERKLREKIEKERNQLEYDKNYFEKYVKELLDPNKK